MSTSSISVNTGSGLPGSTPISISGLASGLDTSAIISEMMAVNSIQLDNTELQQAGVEAQQSELTSIQNALQNLANDSVNLASPTLFSTSQAVSSSDPAIVAASSGVGAGIGGYQVTVTQLANSAQRTFSYATPTLADSISIDGHTTQIQAGASIQQFATDLNNDPNATVYAAVTGSGTVVLSERQTGNTGSNFIQVQDPGSALTEQTALAKEGQNAMFSVDGVAGTSTSNTVTNAVAGVTLNLTGLTTSTGPVTVTVAPPQASSSAVAAAVNQFVSDYNAAISMISTQLSQAPPTSPTSGTVGQGTLYADTDLNSLLSDMRQTMYTDVSGLPSGMSNLADIGISVDTSWSGSGASQSQLEGNLQINSSALTAAITSNPGGVQELLDSFSSSFTSMVDNEAGPGGVIAGRISSDSNQSSEMGNQINSMQYALTQQQQSLETEYSNLESALSLSQSQGSELTSEIAQLP